MASPKFKALVHYVVDSAEDPHSLGATRLNKICWYADVIAYCYKGKSITGETYIKRKHGPVPRTILMTIRELEGEKKISVREHEFLPSKKIRLFQTLKDADSSLFSKEELEIINYCVDTICHHHTAASISEHSHNAIWEAANDGEEIPLVAALVANTAVATDKVIVWAGEVIERASKAAEAA